MSRYIKCIDKREKPRVDDEKLNSVLRLFIEEDKNFSDEHMAAKCGMHIRTYKRRKNKLILDGVLDVRKIGARTYKIVIGYRAICTQDKIHDVFDTKKMVYKMFGEGDSTDKELNIVTTQVPSLSREDAEEYDRIIRDIPMPNEDEIL